MSNASVAKALYRACLRFSSAVDGVPFELLSRDARLLCPHSPLAAVVATQGSQQIRWLAEHEFRQCADHQVTVAGCTLLGLNRSLVQTATHWEPHLPSICSSLHSPLNVIAGGMSDQQLLRLSDKQFFIAYVRPWKSSSSFDHRAQHKLLPQGEAAEAALDRGFAALQVLTSEYGEKVQRMRELRASRADRATAGVAYSVGQVFRDPTCERDGEWASQLNVRHSQPFYHVLPDENDCIRLFNAVRISKYVAQENVELLPQPRRCTHRVLPNYFVGYDPVTGRYVPNAQLAFEYPDASYDQLCAAAPLGADGNLLMRDDPTSQMTASERFLRAALAVESTPQS